MRHAFVTTAAAAAAAAALATVAITPALAAPVKPLDAAAVRASAPTLHVWQEGGLNISFIPTGELVKKVWLDDISRISLDFDGHLCAPEQEGCETAGASVIHLRRITPIHFPGVPKTKTTLLSVVTEKDGRKNLYHFRLAYGTGAPQYVAVDIVPNLTPAERPLLETKAPPARSFTAPVTPAAPPPAPEAVLPPPKEPQDLVVPEPPPPRKREAAPARTVSEVATAVEQGLSSARKQKLISKERRNLYLEARVGRFLTYLREGSSAEESAKRAGIPLHFVETLERLGTKR